MISAEIFHLEKAAFGEKARQRARTAFLQARDWPQLWGYVVAHRLVTISEVISVVNSSDNIDGMYCLADVVAGVGRSADARSILDTIGSNLHRFGSDYTWSSSITESYLSLRPDGVDELYRLAFLLDGNERARADAISSILLASRRHRTGDSRRLISLFDSLSPTDRLGLVPALIDNGSRDCLRRAFGLIEAYSRFEFGRHEPRWGFEFLRLDNSKQVVEFLASISEVDESRMLALQSPLVGRLGTVVWANRRTLEEACVSLLEGANTELRVQKAALRVLALIGNVQLCDICAELSLQEDRVLAFDQLDEVVHSHDNAQIDLAAILLRPILNRNVNDGSTIYREDISLKDFAAEGVENQLRFVEDVLVVGYPQGQWDGTRNLPLFRRGITASPAMLDYNGESKFLIDCAIFPGSSGSPVFLYNFPAYVEDGEVNFGERSALLGVVSSFLAHNVEGTVEEIEIPTATAVTKSPMPSNLGVVIKAREILKLAEVIAREGSAE